MAKPRILIVDDEDGPREALRFILKDRYEIATRDNGAAALAALRADGPFDLLLLDVKMPDLTGLEVLAQVLHLAPGLPVVMATALTDAKPAVEAMKMGAADYLSKPFDKDEIRLVVERILKEKALEKEVGRLRTELQTSYKFENMVGSSPAMQKVYHLIQRLMDNESTVLILGDTGTGKELVARALHYNSVRKDGPFMAVHCAAIPGELLESELFGHEKGSFTGAMQRRIGMFEAANGGTLFLDEIGEMPLGTQSKLLRAIQEREIRRVGSQENIAINVRLVCATNRNLEREVKRGAFREDLFYRINVVPVALPSLRERREDIPLSVAHFLQRFAKELNRPAPAFTAAAMDLFVNYPWPGNVRELEHTIERLMVICDALQIGAEHLPGVITQTDAGAAALTTKLAATVPHPDLGDTVELAAANVDLPKLTEDLERRTITEALKRSGGVMTEAARLLNITRRMLRYKMDKLGIPASQTDADSPADPPAAPSEITGQN